QAVLSSAVLHLFTANRREDVGQIFFPIAKKQRPVSPRLGWRLLKKISYYPGKPGTLSINLVKLGNEKHPPIGAGSGGTRAMLIHHALIGNGQRRARGGKLNVRFAEKFRCTARNLTVETGQRRDITRDQSDKRELHWFLLLLGVRFSQKLSQ